MTSVLTLTPPANPSGISTSGCQQDPAGIPTCTPRILTNRYDTPTAPYLPFQRTVLQGLTER